jgi:thiamine-phosphate pyrophosphorylase
LLLYYISDRTQLSGPESFRRERLLEKIAEAARCGVDYIQLREKDLPARQLEALAGEAVRVIEENGQRKTGKREPGTCLLINSRTDIAFAAGASGVHLRSDDISPSEVHRIWNPGGARPASTSLPARAIPPPRATVVVSCHTVREVARAAEQGADFAAVAPVFEKRDWSPKSPAGLDTLRQACRYKIPVFALGGVTLANVAICRDAGVAGIAAIRLFQDNDIGEVVRRLRG